MFQYLISIILGVICTEAITELIVHSDIMSPIRELADNYNDFASKLVNCGYCCSIWAAAFCAYFMAPLLLPTQTAFVNFVIWTLTFHRLSKFLDDFVDKYLAKNTNNDDNMFDEADAQFGITESSQVPLDESDE